MRQYWDQEVKETMVCTNVVSDAIICGFSEKNQVSPWILDCRVNYMKIKGSHAKFRTNEAKRATQITVYFNERIQFFKSLYFNF